MTQRIRRISNTGLGRTRDAQASSLARTRAARKNIHDIWRILGKERDA
jgi:hypothetical protein